MAKIEAHGIRSEKGLLVRLENVESEFGLKNLKKTLTHKDSVYTIDIDYVLMKNNKETYKETVKKEIYLTYEGIIKVLFASNSGKVKEFKKWATDTLFTVQMGTIKQKQRLASNLLGIDANTVREVFNKTSTTVVCIYLFYLGTVKDLRKIMNIDEKYPDSMCVYKWGKTNNLLRRTGEHIDTFAGLGIDIKLARYNYIDPQYMTDAERDLKNIIKGLGYHFIFTPTKEQVAKDGKKLDPMEELAIMSKKDLETIEKQYDQISKNYIGHVNELVTKIKDLENTLKLNEATSALELCKANNQIAIYTIQIEHMQTKFREQELLNKINILEMRQK